ncbi:MAG: flagellar hook-associated protein FlgL [Pedobacter sp.]
MRITANITSDNALYNIQQGRAKLDKISEQTSSGKNVNRPSDDPINTRLLLDVGDKVKVTDQYTSNISKASTWQQIANTALTGMSDTMQLAKQQIATISNGSSDATVRQSAVSQLKALKQQMVDMGNTQMGDQYIFGGAMNTTAPFSATAPYYAGDESALNVEIANNTTQQMNIPGNQLLTADTAVSQPYGTTNILKAFDDLITAVGANDVTAIVAGSQALEAGAVQINNVQSDVASRVTRLDSMTKLNANNSNTLNNIYSNIQNADYAKLAVELSQQNTAFEASLSATAKISQLSLLDYL